MFLPKDGKLLNVQSTLGLSTSSVPGVNKNVVSITYCEACLLEIGIERIRIKASLTRTNLSDYKTNGTVRL